MSTKSRRLKQTESIPEPVAEPVAAEPVIVTETVAAPKKRKPAGPPTEKQLAAREQFKIKVAEAQALRKAVPGLKYNEAIKRVYAKVPPTN